MKVKLLTDSNNVVRGVINYEGEELNSLTPRDFQGDPNFAYIGTRTYDGVNLVEYAPPKSVIPRSEFVSRITNAEMDALLMSEEVAAKKLLMIMNTMEQVDLKNEMLASAINGLSLFTDARKIQLLG